MNSPTSGRAGSTRGRNSAPEVVELAHVEERRRLDDDFVPHLEVPGVGVEVALAIPGHPLGVEEDDHHVAVRVEAADAWDEPLRHPGVERGDDLIEELLAAVGLREGRCADNRPLRNRQALAGPEAA